eukprot:g12926.t1
MRPSTTHGSPIPATTSGGPAQNNGLIGANGGTRGCKKRRREGNRKRKKGQDGASSDDRIPPPSRRTDFDSDSGSDRDSSSSSSSGDEHRQPGRGTAPAPACRPETNSAGNQRREGGADGMQVEFDSDSDLGGSAGVVSAEKRGSSQQPDQEAGPPFREEEEKQDGVGRLDVDDEDGKGLKPTLSGAPFQDTEMRPLVLTNEAGGERAEVPAAVNRYLKDYQREGVEFMYRRVRHADGPKGVILADDMGLGKTVQTISLLLALLKKKGTGQDVKDLNARRKHKEHVSAAGKPILIVCPTALLSSWEKHLKEWGHFESRSILGGNPKRSAQSAETLLDAGQLEVVVVGQAMFRNSVDTLSKFDWLVVVFDEVHDFKNPKSKRAEAVDKMDKAEVLIGLTGTLVQNSLLDLWTVTNMIEPGCFGGRKDFEHHFVTPYLRGRKRGASRVDCEIGAERLKELQELRAKVVLRRDKSVLGDLLKGKIGTVVFCDLAEVQKLIYRTVLALPEFRLLATANEPCPCGRVDAKSGSCCGTYPKDETSEDEVDPKAVIWRRFHPNLTVCDKGPGCPYCVTFSAISKLQKLANHPCQLQVKPLREYEGMPEKMLHDIAFAQVAFSEQALAIMATRPGDDDDGASYSAFAGAGAEGGISGGGGGAVGGGEDWDRRLARPENFLQLCRDDTCGKMRTLKVLLERFRNKEKVLLFSYSTAMLDILQMLCSSEGYSFIRLDGNTKKDQRSEMIERFAKEDALGSNIFLISTKAGGTGLNLQSANKVILYDVNWNPAQDTQAEDRAYRIGQLRGVEVIRLVSTGTIEELTYMRHIYKLQTSAAAMGDKSDGGLRQFEGVQGDSSQQGELWGLSNLMKFSGESMLIKLRQEHGAGLPPLVRDSKDNLVMEPQENIVNVLNKYAAAENSNSGDGGATEEDRGQGFGGEEGEEEEFDDVGWGGVGAAGSGADPVKKNAELGGVVMAHDDMVAADQEEELPPGTQESINEVEMMDDDDTDDDGMDEAMDEAMGDADGGDCGPAGAQVEGDGGEQAADEPSWALAPTQPPNDVLEHDHEGEHGDGREQQASQVVSASSPSGVDVNAIHPSAENPSGLSGGKTRCTAGRCESVPGTESGAVGNRAAADDGVLSQAEAGAGAVAAARGRGGVPNQFLYAPAAQNVLDVFDDVDGGEEKDLREQKEQKEQKEEQEREESKVEYEYEYEYEYEEREHGQRKGGAGGTEGTRERSSSAGSSLDLEIPFTTHGDGGNDGLGAGAGARGPPGNNPVGAGTPPQQEDLDSSSELDLCVSTFPNVSFSAETQPPPGCL